MKLKKLAPVLFILILIAFFAASAAGAEEETDITEIPAQNVLFASSDLISYDGRGFQVDYTLEPAGSTGALSWSSGNKAIATVDADGLVSAIKAGATTITARLPNGKSATANLTVRATKVSLSKTTLITYVGQTTELAAQASPEGADFIAAWSSDNAKIASVDQSGNVTGKQTGATYINARFANGQSARCYVVVRKVLVKMDKTDITLYRTQQRALNALLTPADSTAAIKWSSSKPTVARVDQSGNVSARAVGTAYIYATLTNGNRASCKVTVRAETVVFESSKVTIYEGQTVPIKAVLKPESLAAVITWKSSKTSVATVNAAGEVYGKAAGTAVITARLSNGSTATCTVTVQKCSVELPDSLTISPGEKHALKPVFAPAAAAGSKITWSSDNTSIATVDKNGRVTGLLAGTANVNARLVNGKLSVCNVIVTDDRVESIVIDQSDITFRTGETRKLTVSVYPPEAANHAVKWSSSDRKVARVSDNGVVSIVGPGTATITAESKDGGKKAHCQVTAPTPAYRALLIGEFTKPNQIQTMPFVSQGVHSMLSALSSANVMGTQYAINAYVDEPNKAAIRLFIQNTFSATTADDVSFLFILSHGIDYQGSYLLTLPGWYTNVGNAVDYAISIPELFGWLDGIRGHMVLVINTCNSGKVVLDAPGLLAMGHSLNNNITIITSSQWKVSSAWYNGSPYKYDFLSYALSRAMGWDASTSKQLGAVYGDLNNDGIVTTGELVDFAKASLAERVSKFYGKPTYVCSKNGKPVAQIYTTNRNVPIFAR